MKNDCKINVNYCKFLGKWLTKASSSLQIKCLKHSFGICMFQKMWKVMKTLCTVTLFIVMMGIHENRNQFGMGGNGHINETRVTFSVFTPLMPDGYKSPCILKQMCLYP